MTVTTHDPVRPVSALSPPWGHTASPPPPIGAPWAVFVRAAALVVALVSGPAMAHCQDALAESPSGTVVTHDGTRGVWWALPTAQELTKRYRLAPELQVVLTKTEAKLSLCEGRLVAGARVIELADDRAEVIDAALVKSVAREEQSAARSRTAEDKVRRVRWRNFSIGGVVGLVVAIAVFGLASSL